MYVCVYIYVYVCTHMSSDFLSTYNKCRKNKNQYKCIGYCWLKSVNEAHN